MRTLSGVMAAVAVLGLCAAGWAQSDPVRGYSDAVERDYPSIQLRFGRGSPANIGKEGRVALLGGAGFTTQGVNLFNDYTIEWWQYVSDVDQPHAVVRIGGRDIGVVPMPREKDTDPPRGAISAGDPALHSATAVYPGKWYHAAIVVAGGTTQFFVNGHPEPTIDRARKPSGELTLGSDVTGSTVNADVAIYNAAMPARTIRSHFKTALASMPQRQVDTIGHRGDFKNAPEDTNASYASAIANGTRIVAMDVRLTKDGVPVLMHDPTVDRTTNGKGAIADMTLADVQKLDAGSRKDARYQGEPVPQVQTIAQTCRGKAVMMLNLKCSGLGQALADLKSKTNYPSDQWIVASREDDEGIAVRKLLPDVPMIRMSSKIPTDNPDNAYFSRMKQIGFYGFSIDWRYLNDAFIDAAHRNGFKVYTWTVNDPPEVAGAVLAGVDGIITDDVPNTVKLVAELMRK